MAYIASIARSGDQDCYCRWYSVSTSMYSRFDFAGTSKLLFLIFWKFIV
jgi:hypothetical protein